MKSDQHTFSKIVGEYMQPLYWHIRRIVISHEDAQDVLQETLIKAYRKLWLLCDSSSLRPWLYRIATNEALNFLKKKSAFVPLDEYLVSSLEASEYVDYTKEGEIKLQKALLGLSPQQRAVFCMKYYDEMDYDEIAKITGSKAETLKVSYHYAKEKVKNFLENN